MSLRETLTNALGLSTAPARPDRAELLKRKLELEAAAGDLLPANARCEGCRQAEAENERRRQALAAHGAARDHIERLLGEAEPESLRALRRWLGEQADDLRARRASLVANKNLLGRVKDVESNLEYLRSVSAALRQAHVDAETLRYCPEAELPARVAEIKTAVLAAFRAPEKTSLAPTPELLLHVAPVREPKVRELNTPPGYDPDEHVIQKLRAL